MWDSVLSSCLDLLLPITHACVVLSSVNLASFKFCNSINKIMCSSLTVYRPYLFFTLSLLKFAFCLHLIRETYFFNVICDISTQIPFSNKISCDTFSYFQKFVNEPITATVIFMSPFAEYLIKCYFILYKEVCMKY